MPSTTPLRADVLAKIYLTRPRRLPHAKACTSQGTGVCTTDATVCATKAGQTTTMACAVAVAGYSPLDGGIAIGTYVRVYLAWLRGRARAHLVPHLAQPY